MRTISVRIGFFHKNKWKGFLSTLLANGSKFSASSGHGPCGQDWHITADEDVLETIKNYCDINQ